jgi:hypothetical protein
MTMSAADERVTAMLALTEELTGNLLLDCQAFEAHRPHEAAERGQHTARLANLYRHESARIRQDPSSVAAAAPMLRKRLLQSAEALDAVLARHGRAIHAAKTVSEGLVHAIATEVANQRGATGGSYGPSGGSVAPSPSAATSITLNRRA